MHAKFRRRFDINRFRSKSMIDRWVKKFNSKGIVLKMSARSEKVTTGRHLNVRFPGHVDAVRPSVGRSRIQECLYRNGGHLEHIFERA